MPGRDLLIQAWYQGGLTLIDFSDSSNPKEIAFFDRGPINTPNPTGLNLGGLWSTYWYNGYIYGSEIARGFDTFGLLTSGQMSENEIDAATEAQVDEFNSQHQTPITWEPSFNVVGSFFDQAVRSGALSGKTLKKVAKELEKAEEKAAKKPEKAIEPLEKAMRELKRTGDQGELRQAIKDLIKVLDRDD